MARAGRGRLHPESTSQDLPRPPGSAYGNQVRFRLTPAGASRYLDGRTAAIRRVADRPKKSSSVGRLAYRIDRIEIVGNSSPPSRGYTAARQRLLPGRVIASYVPNWSLYRPKVVEPFLGLAAVEGERTFAVRLRSGSTVDLVRASASPDPRASPAIRACPASRHRATPLGLRVVARAQSTRGGDFDLASFSWFKRGGAEAGEIKDLYESGIQNYRAAASELSRRPRPELTRFSTSRRARPQPSRRSHCE